MLYLEDTRMVKSGTAKTTGKSFFGNILQAVGAGVSSFNPIIYGIY